MERASKNCRFRLFSSDIVAPFSGLASLASGQVSPVGVRNADRLPTLLVLEDLIIPAADAADFEVALVLPVQVDRLVAGDGEDLAGGDDAARVGLKLLFALSEVDVRHLFGAQAAVADVDRGDDVALRRRPVNDETLVATAAAGRQQEGRQQRHAGSRARAEFRQACRRLHGAFPSWPSASPGCVRRRRRRAMRRSSASRTPTSGPGKLSRLPGGGTPPASSITSPAMVVKSSSSISRSKRRSILPTSVEPSTS